MRYAIHSRTGHVVAATDEVLRNCDYWEITPETAVAIETKQITASATLLQYRESLRSGGISNPTPNAPEYNNVRKSLFTPEKETKNTGPFQPNIPTVVQGGTPPVGTENEEGGKEPTVQTTGGAFKIPPQIGQMKHASLLKFAGKNGVAVPADLAATDTPENCEAIRAVLNQAAAAATPSGNATQSE